MRVFFGYFLDSRLRRSPFGPASPFAPQAAQCDKESYPRVSAEALQLFFDGYRYAPTHPTLLQILSYGFRPHDHSEPMDQRVIVDPKGGAHDVRRFSTRQDAASKNPGYFADGRFAPVLRVFFGDFLCDKESYPRVSAEALQLLLDGYRCAQPILPCLLTTLLRSGLTPKELQCFSSLQERSWRLSPSTS